MKRREFLKYTGIAAAAAAAPITLADIETGDVPTVVDDWAIHANGDIRYIGTSDRNYTVLELHRYLQNLADDIPSDGMMDITWETPSLRCTDQIVELTGDWNIDDNAAEHLYGGSISQNDGNDIYASLLVLGSVGTSTDETVNAEQPGIFIYQGDNTTFCSIDRDCQSSQLLETMVKYKTNGELVNNGRVTVMSSRKVKLTLAEGANNFRWDYNTFILGMAKGVNVTAMVV